MPTLCIPNLTSKYRHTKKWILISAKRHEQECYRNIMCNSSKPGAVLNICQHLYKLIVQVNNIEILYSIKKEAMIPTWNNTGES